MECVRLASETRRGGLSTRGGLPPQANSYAAAQARASLPHIQNPADLATLNAER